MKLGLLFEGKITMKIQYSLEEFSEFTINPGHTETLESLEKSLWKCSVHALEIMQGNREKSIPISENHGNLRKFMNARVHFSVEGFSLQFSAP